LHANICASLLDEVLKGESVHDGAQHAHVVRTTAIHATVRKFRSPKEVATANDNCYLYLFGGASDAFCNAGNHVWVYTQ